MRRAPASASMFFLFADARRHFHFCPPNPQSMPALSGSSTGGTWKGTDVQIGRVVGTVVATQKHGKLESAKLLLVQPLGLDARPTGVPVLAIDSVGAGVGEKVLVVIEGKAAGSALRRKAAPV